MKIPVGLLTQISDTIKDRGLKVGDHVAIPIWPRRPQRVLASNAAPTNERIDIAHVGILTNDHGELIASIPDDVIERWSDL